MPSCNYILQPDTTSHCANCERNTLYSWRLRGSDELSFLNLVWNQGTNYDFSQHEFRKQARRLPRVLSQLLMLAQCTALKGGTVPDSSTLVYYPLVFKFPAPAVLESQGVRKTTGLMFLIQSLPACLSHTLKCHSPINTTDSSAPSECKPRHSLGPGPWHSLWTWSMPCLHPENTGPSVASPPPVLPSPRFQQPQMLHFGVVWTQGREAGWAKPSSLPTAPSASMPPPAPPAQHLGAFPTPNTQVGLPLVPCADPGVSQRCPKGHSRLLHNRLSQRNTMCWLIEAEFSLQYAPRK